MAENAGKYGPDGQVWLGSKSERRRRLSCSRHVPLLVSSLKPGCSGRWGDVHFDPSPHQQRPALVCDNVPDPVVWLIAGKSDQTLFNENIRR